MFDFGDNVDRKPATVNTFGKTATNQRQSPLSTLGQCVRALTPFNIC